MTSSTSISLLFWYIANCLVSVAVGTHYPGIIYLADYCDIHYAVYSDVTIKLAKTTYLPQNTTCTMTLIPYHGTKLVARFLAYRMNQSYVNESGECAFESIQLYNAEEEESVISGNENYCSSVKPPYQYDLGNEGWFRYTTTRHPKIYAADVDLLVSEVVMRSQSSGSPCPDGYFDCHNNYCVTEDVTFNEVDDCGNNRDEEKYSQGCRFTPEIVIGIVICSTLFY